MLQVYSDYSNITCPNIVLTYRISFRQLDIFNCFTVKVKKKYIRISLLGWIPETTEFLCAKLDFVVSNFKNLLQNYETNVTQT